MVSRVPINDDDGDAHEAVFPTRFIGFALTSRYDEEALEGRVREYGQYERSVLGSRDQRRILRRTARDIRAVGLLVALTIAATLGVTVGAHDSWVSRQVTELVVPAAVLAVAALVAWTRPDVGLFALVGLLPFQQVIFGRLFTAGVSVPVLAVSRFWKEAIVLSLVAKLLQEWPHEWDGIDRAVLWFLGIVFVYLVLPVGPSWYVRLVAARTDAVFLLLFLAARHLDLPRIAADRLQAIVLVSGSVLAVFAFWNSFSPEEFGRWIEELGVLEYSRTVLGVPNPGSAVAYGTMGSATIVRAGSLLLGPITLGFYMLLPVAIAVGRIAEGKARSWQVVFGGLSAAGLIVTLTRSAIGVVPLMVLVAALAGWRRERLAAPLVAGLVVLLPLASSIGVGPRVASGFDPSEPTTAAHIEHLKEGRERILEHPLGTGLGTAGSVSFRFFVLSGIVNESWYLQLATEIGIIGLFLYLLVLVRVLRRLWQAARRESSGSVAALCAMAAIAVGGIVLHNLEDQSISVTLWILAGMMLRRSGMQREEEPVRLTAPSARLAVAAGR